MIPRLYNTADITTAGISLADTISCVVDEERNGVFDLTMVVATTTPYFEELAEGKYILAKPNHTQNPQLFEIYEITRPILQRVTVRAHHISYRLSFIPVEPFSCTGIEDTLDGLISHSMETNPFTFTTDITNAASTYNQTAPASLRSRLGGTEGSVLDVFGGEYLWDNFTVNLLLHRGQNNGVQLRVAKNISALEQTTNMENVVTGALPYWSNDDGTVNLYGDIQYNSNASDYPYKRTVLLDLSEQFETTPTSSQLNSAAQQYVNQANLGVVNTNIKLSFVDLADTEEYKGSPLERVNLCDTVTVIYSPLQISYQAKAIRLSYDVLAERTLEVEVGDARSTISKTITDLVGDVSSVITTGKKLVSVTQKIDREVGSITQTVSSVQDIVIGDPDDPDDTGMQGTLSTLSESVQNLEGFQRTVSETYATKTDLGDLEETFQYQTQETARGVQDSFTKIEKQITDQGTVVTELTTYIRRTNRGLEISKNTEDINMVLENDELGFYQGEGANAPELAWLSASEGLGAPALSVGDATTLSKRWRIVTRQDGSHLTFTRHN